MDRHNYEMKCIYFIKATDGKTYGANVVNGKFVRAKTAAHGKCVSSFARAFHMFTNDPNDTYGITHCSVCNEPF